MSRDQAKDKTKGLRDSVDSQQSVSFEHQSEVIQYVHEVKEALNQLVDRVVMDQEETSKICAQTRDALLHQTESVADTEQANFELRQQVNQLQSERDELAGLLKQSGEKLEAAKGRLRDESRKLEEAEVDVHALEELKSRLGEEATSNEAARRHIAKLEQTILSLEKNQEDVNAAHVALEEAQSTVAKLEELNEGQAKRIVDLSESIAVIESERDDVRRSAQDRESKVDTAMQEATELRDARDAAQEFANGLRESLSQAEEEKSSLTETIHTLTADLETQHQRAQALEQELLTTRDTYADTDSTLKGYTDRIGLLEQTSHTNESTIAALKDELAQTHQRAEQFEEQMNVLREQTRKAVEAEQNHAARMEEIQAEIHDQAGLEADHRQLSEHYDVLEAQAKKLRTENERIHEELETELSKGTKSILAQQLSDALREQESSRDTIRALRSEVETLRGELSAKRATQDAQARVDIEFDDIGARQRLGELLVKSGTITQAQLDDVITEREATEYNGRIGQLFVDKGYATEDIVAQALSHQMGVPFLRIEHNTIRHDAIRLISEKLADKHNCIPVNYEKGELVLAMENPMDLIAIEDVERACEYPVRPMIATGTDIRRAIKQHYQGRRNSL